MEIKCGIFYKLYNKILRFISGLPLSSNDFNTHDKHGELPMPNDFILAFDIVGWPTNDIKG